MKSIKLLMINLKHNLEIFSPPKDLVKDFEELNHNISEKEKKLEESIAICSKIMNVRKAPYILNYSPAATSAIAE